MNASLGRAGVTLGLAATLLAALALATIVVRRSRRAAAGLPDDPSLRMAASVSSMVAATVSLVCAAIAFGAMERALVTRDFSIAYVARVGSHATPALYNVAALWSALEGSLLLWVLLLAGFTFAVAVKFRHRLDDPLVVWAMVTMFVVSAFFFLLLAGPADAFKGISPVPADGPGPNPLLQNHVLMAFHPPVLYVGLVGMTVPFAFAIGALVTGRMGEGWLVATRRWALVAWGGLSAGILLGAWWSYEVLGWGGYWGWDPVENAALLPWLTATAYLHSVMVQERRGMLRVWNLSLLTATFALTILETFLTRSGVLQSVHSFSESDIGKYLLGFFAAVVVVSVVLIGWRADALRSPGSIDSPVSREGAFLVNNLLFAAFAFVVLLGTVFPLVLEAANGDQVSVGPPYFRRMTMPLGLALLFLMAVAPVLPWRKAAGEVLSRRLLWPAWAGTGALVVAVAVGARGLAPLVGFALGGFAAGAAARQLVLAGRRHGVRGLAGRAAGGMVVHLGVVVIAVAFTASQSFTSSAEFVLAPGETATLVGHELTYEGLARTSSDTREVVKARVRIDGGDVYEPALTRYTQMPGGQTIGTPSVRTGVLRDVYLTLLEVPDTEGGQARIRAQVTPLAAWLWAGGGIVALGTALALVPGSRRRRVAEAVPAAAPRVARHEESVGAR